MHEKYEKAIQMFLWAFTSVFLITMLTQTKMHEEFNDKVLENATTYSDDIEKYNEFLQEYAKYVRSLNLNDLETIMKVISDEWNSDVSLGMPEKIEGFQRLSFQREGIGVCESFADDFTAKMNAINTEYNAKNLYCNFVKSQDEYIDVVDIKRDTSKLNEKLLSSNNEFINRNINNLITFIDELLVNIIGSFSANHMITMINIPNSDYTLVVDPTNFLIGQIKDGNIYIFNDYSYNTIKYNEKANQFFGGDNYVSLKNTQYLSNYNKEELQKMYGLDAQKQALNTVKQLNDTNKVMQIKKKLY